MKRVKRILDELKKEKEALELSNLELDYIRAEGYEQAISTISRLYEDVREKDKTDIKKEAWKEIRKVNRSFERIAKDVEERRDKRFEGSTTSDVDAAFFVAYDTIANDINKQIRKATKKYNG